MRLSAFDTGIFFAHSSRFIESTSVVVSGVRVCMSAQVSVCMRDAVVYGFDLCAIVKRRLWTSEYIVVVLVMSNTRLNIRSFAVV